MFKKLGVAALVAGLMATGFILGVVGQSTNTLGATSYDRTNLVGDVYQGIQNNLMMQGGYMVGPIKETTRTITGGTSVTLAETGKTFYISTTGGTTTLPAVSTASGAIYKFVVGAAFTGTSSISSIDGGIIEGSLIVGGAVVNCTGATNISFDGTGEDVGDFVELRSNGVKWFIGSSNALTASRLVCN